MLNFTLHLWSKLQISEPYLAIANNDDEALQIKCLKCILLKVFRNVFATSTDSKWSKNDFYICWLVKLLFSATI